MKLEELTNKINENVRNAQITGMKETVSKNDSIIALEILVNSSIRTERDVLSFCAALNLLNTYVKQEDSDINYSFKICINRLFEVLSRGNYPNVRIDFHSEENCFYIRIHHVQFSFHRIKKTPSFYKLINNNRNYFSMEWDELRKQMCAVTVFNMSIEHKENYIDFLELTNELNKKIIAAQNSEKESITPELCKEALKIVESLIINTEKDVLRFCSAMVVLNSFVEQKNSNITYAFKRNMERLFFAMANNYFPHITIDFVGDSEITKKFSTRLFVQIGAVQFNYHGINKSSTAERIIHRQKLNSHIVYDEVHKKKIASTIFYLVQSSIY